MKVIQIIVQPDGQTRVETKGFTGAECRDASRFIEESLGKRIDEQLTSEFYAEETTRQRNQQRT